MIIKKVTTRLAVLFVALVAATGTLVGFSTSPAVAIDETIVEGSTNCEIIHESVHICAYLTTYVKDGQLRVRAKGRVRNINEDELDWRIRVRKAVLFRDGSRVTSRFNPGGYADTVTTFGTYSTTRMGAFKSMVEGCWISKVDSSRRGCEPVYSRTRSVG